MTIQLIYKVFLLLLIHDKPITYSTFLLKKRLRYMYEYIIKHTPIKLIEKYPSCRLQYRIYWILHDLKDFPTCARNNCENKVFKFNGIKYGYTKHCCCRCALLDNDKNNFKTNSPIKNPEKRKAAEEKKLKKYGSKNNIIKIVETHYKNNNGKYFSDEQNEKRIKTRRDKNDGNYFSDESLKKLSANLLKYYKSAEFQQRIDSGIFKIGYEKGVETKRKNKVLNTSKSEDIAYSLLLEIFPLLRRLFKSNVYPFYCDFYDPITDTYIEYNGNWTHNTHQYNENNPTDILNVQIWQEKSKNSKFYKNALYNWTVSDVLKRNTAKTNNLNYIELWNLDDVNLFIEKIRKL